MADAHGDATIKPDSPLDATGLLCPLPVLKARRARKAVPPGGILEVLATDPGATKDFQHFCQTTGCELLESGELPGGVLRFLLKKPGGRVRVDGRFDPEPAPDVGRRRGAVRSAGADEPPRSHAPANR